MSHHNPPSISSRNASTPPEIISKGDSQRLVRAADCLGSALAARAAVRGVPASVRLGSLKRSSTGSNSASNALPLAGVGMAVGGGGEAGVGSGFLLVVGGLAGFVLAG